MAVVDHEVLQERDFSEMFEALVAINLLALNGLSSRVASTKNYLKELCPLVAPPGLVIEVRPRQGSRRIPLQLAYVDNESQELVAFRPGDYAYEARLDRVNNDGLVDSVFRGQSLALPNGAENVWVYSGESATYASLNDHTTAQIITLQTKVDQCF